MLRASLLILLAGRTLTLGAAAPRQPGHLDPIDEWARNHTSWQWRHDPKYDSITFARENPLLLPRGNATEPAHVEALGVLLGDVVRALKMLRRCAPAACNRSDEAIAKWQAMVDKLRSGGAPLLKSEYFDALEAVRKAAVALSSGCTMEYPETDLVPLAASQLLQHHVLLVGLLYDACGYDSLPSYLMDRPWETALALLSVAGP
ncbi:hypothetical protein HRG_006284 [Hirsutella rhossiliensis]|uniref:Uncharacterized protein n=1 Tax=Hirsutella rhossiliensis TaxID=111463 RepID=A0A9P8MW85_9HYPO|nr:uncharacterized protein HRG_06284 [Hirsutella rhossiliensis]KAH0962182.1 hypothetical protein HRG_06284 [Hirsutella rhossiliensis]